MAWVRLDDQFARHPKMIAAKPDGMAMQVAAICYCNQYLTDGWVPDDVVKSLLNVKRPGEIVARLCIVGAWTKHEGGYRVHDYLHFQPSRKQVLAERKKARDRQEKARLSRRDSHSDKQRDTAVTQPVVTPDVTPTPTRTQEVLLDTTAADTPKSTSSTTEASYVETEDQEIPAAVVAAATEQEILAACTRFGAEPNIAEPWARQLTGDELAAIVKTMEMKIRRNTVEHPPAQFVDLLKRRVAANVKAASSVKIRIPTLEENLHADAVSYARGRHPWDVAAELLTHKMTKLDVPADRQAELLDELHRAYDENAEAA